MDDLKKRISSIPIMKYYTTMSLTSANAQNTSALFKGGMRPDFCTVQIMRQKADHKTGKVTKNGKSGRV